MGSGVGPGGYELLLCVCVQCPHGGMLFWPDPAFTVTAAKSGTEAAIWREQVAAGPWCVVRDVASLSDTGGLCSALSRDREKALGKTKGAGLWVRSAWPRGFARAEL